MLVEADDDVGAVGHHGNTHPAADLAPFPERVYVFGDVELLELTPLLLEPILDPEAMGSGRGGVDFDVCHESPQSVNGDGDPVKPPVCMFWFPANVCDYVAKSSITAVSRS